VKKPPTKFPATKSHAQKLRVLDWLRHHRVAVTLNFVISPPVTSINSKKCWLLAESSCATRIEFANVQYYGWAFANRENLLPTATVNHSSNF